MRATPQRLSARAVLIALAGLLALAVVAGCAAANDADTPTPDAETPSGSATPSVEGTTSIGQLAAPGIYDLGNERVQALGTLEYRDLEGGFWAVVNRMPGDARTDAGIVAVLVDTENSNTELEALKGKYVAAEGERMTGASIRQAGPEIELKSIREVTDTSVAPGTSGGSPDDPGDDSSDDAPTP